MPAQADGPDTASDAASAPPCAHTQRRSWAHLAPASSPSTSPSAPPAADGSGCSPPSPIPPPSGKLSATGQPTLCGVGVGRGSAQRPEGTRFRAPRPRPWDPGTMRARPAALGARMPWYRIRLSRRGGTRAASFSINAVGESSIRYVPSLQTDSGRKRPSPNPESAGGVQGEAARRITNPSFGSRSFRKRAVRAGLAGCGASCSPCQRSLTGLWRTSPSILSETAPRHSCLSLDRRRGLPPQRPGARCLSRRQKRDFPKRGEFLGSRDQDKPGPD